MVEIFVILGVLIAAWAVAVFIVKAVGRRIGGIR